MAKQKKGKIVLFVISVLLLILLVVAGVLFFPLHGKKHTEIWSAKQSFDLSKTGSVEKQPGEDFRILLLTDTQLWMDPAENKKTYAQIEALVKKTNPHLIATTGDNVSGVTSRFLTRKFAKVMDSFGVPWTAVFGNHDNEIPMTSLNWQADQFMKMKHSLFQKGPSNLYGCGNHVVNITENGAPWYSLFFFDNGRYMEYEDGAKKEIYMGYEQIAWYEWNVRGMAAQTGAVVPSMVFSHFALPEFRQAVEEYGVKDEQTGRYTIPEPYGFGQCDYLPGASPVNSGFFDKCRELGSTKYIFCGHDHENNASVRRDGITMTYGLKTGPSPVPWNHAGQTGGTLITVEKNRNVKIDTISLT